jgi:hypothetical protein
MGDYDRRRLEREFAESGDVNVAAKLLAKKVRRGELSSFRISVAARFGHEPSQVLSGQGAYTDILDVIKFLDNSDLSLRVALKACQFIYPIWDLSQVPENPRRWLEMRGGRTRETNETHARHVLLHATIGLLQVTQAVTYEELTHGYPGFAYSTHWTGIVQKLREHYYKETGDLMHYVRDIPNYFNILEASLKGVNVNLSVAFAITMEEVENIRWLVHLMQMSLAGYKNQFTSCIFECLRYVPDRELLTEINKEVVKWALR